MQTAHGTTLPQHWLSHYRTTGRALSEASCSPNNRSLSLSLLPSLSLSLSLPPMPISSSYDLAPLVVMSLLLAGATPGGSPGGGIWESPAHVHLPSSLHAFEKEERRREMESALLNVCNTQRVTHITHQIHRQHCLLLTCLLWKYE